jgi:hypothetical protein
MSCNPGILEQLPGMIFGGENSRPSDSVEAGAFQCANECPAGQLNRKPDYSVQIDMIEKDLERITVTCSSRKSSGRCFCCHGVAG